MAQLKRGARTALDQLLAAIAEADEQRRLALRVAITNPRYNQDKLIEQGGVLDRLRILVANLEPLLERNERAEPDILQRLEELERRMHDIETQRVIPFRKEA